MPLVVTQSEATNSDVSRIGTYSAMDFSWWATINAETDVEQASLAEGTDNNPASVITWAAGRVGLELPSTFADLVTYCEDTHITVEAALKKRGCLLFSTESVAVTLGFSDIVDYQFKKRVIRRVNNIDLEDWTYGATITGLRY